MRFFLVFACFFLLQVKPAISGSEMPPGYQVTGRISGTFLVACEVGKPAESAKCIHIPVQEQPLLPLAQPTTVANSAVEPDNNEPGEKPKDVEGSAEAMKPASPAPRPLAAKDAFEKVEQLTQFDLSVPASPAFAALGLSPEKIQRPGSARDFAASLVRSVGTDGELVNGVAIDISPASVFFRKHIIGGSLYSNEDERDANLKNWHKRVLARTTVSVGTVEGDKSGTSKIALGFRIGIWDEGDPGLYVKDLVKCLSYAERPVDIGGRTSNIVPTDGKLRSCDPTQNGNLALWAKPALYAGIGKYWYSSTGRVTDQSDGAKNLWLTYSQGLVRRDRNGFVEKDGTRTLVQAYLARRLNDRFTRDEQPNALLQQNSSEVIIRLRSGRSTWHGYLELGRRRAKTEGTFTENIKHLGFGAEFKLSIGDDIWVQLAQVRERGFSDGKDKNAITANIRFGTAFLSFPGPAD